MYRFDDNSVQDSHIITYISFLDLWNALRFKVMFVIPGKFYVILDRNLCSLCRQSVIQVACRRYFFQNDYFWSWLRFPPFIFILFEILIITFLTHKYAIKKIDNKWWHVNSFHLINGGRTSLLKQRNKKQKQKQNKKQTNKQKSASA